MKKVVRSKFGTRALWVSGSSVKVGKTLQQCWSEHWSNVDSNIAAMFGGVKRSIQETGTIVPPDLSVGLVPRNASIEQQQPCKAAEKEYADD